MAKKIVESEEVKQEDPARTGNSFFDYLKFGESYTSLILGIVVVIISTALLLSFFNNRHTTPTNQVTQESQSIAEISQKALRLSNNQRASVTTVPSQAATVTATPTITQVVQSTTKPTSKPTAQPTEAKKVAQATAVPTKPQAKPTEPAPPKAGEYTVKAGDTLWVIAERHYKSGYNWVDIARANKLSNPGQISAGSKLKLPKVTAKAPTIQSDKKIGMEKEQKNTTVAGGKITGNSYKVVKGDSLWTIAVRAYGDGHKWSDIAKANKLTNPNTIHPGNQFMLPRGK